MSARDVLAQRTGNTNAVSFDAYFARKRGAKKFVQEWLAMRATGETDWSAAQVLRHLRDKMDCPLKSVSAFRAYLAENYTKQYRHVT